MPRLLPPLFRAPAPPAPPLMLSDGRPPRGGLFAVFLIFAIMGYALLTIDPAPPSSTANPSQLERYTPPTLRPPSTQPPPPPTSPPPYRLDNDQWQALAIEATTVAQQLAEIDGRLQASTNLEREQLQNDRTRLQNAAAALDVTRAALDAHNNAAATAVAVSAQATTAAQQNQYMARATQISIEATAEAGEIQRQHQRAAANLAAAEAATAATSAATAAALNKIMVTAAAIGAGVLIVFIVFAAAYAIATHGRALLASIQAHATAATPAPPLSLPTTAESPTDPTEWMRQALDELAHEMRTNQPRPTHPPHRVPEVDTSPVPSPVHPKISPSTPLTPEIKSRIIAAYRAQQGSIRATSRTIFTYGNGRTDDIVRAVLDEAQVNHN